MANIDEGRELVKRLMRERLVEKVGANNIVYHGEEINVTVGDDGRMRFNLPRLRKAYVEKSSRVYEVEYTEDSPVRVEIAEQLPAVAIHLNYEGEPEEVDTTVFKNRVVCSCGSVRYVKNADLFQVKKCKPCTIRERGERRRKRP